MITRSILNHNQFHVVNKTEEFAIDTATDTDVWLPLTDGNYAVFAILPSALTNTVSIKVLQADNSAGTDHTELTGKTMTLAADDDDLLQIIEVYVGELSGDNTYVGLEITANTAAATLSVIGMVANLHTEPVTQGATVDQTLAATESA